LRGKGVYASSELTSGRRAQRLQRDHGVADSGTLRELLGSERYDALVWNPNVAAAIAFACELRDRMDGAELVISPAPFIAPGWPQSAYLAFWETVLRTRVKAVYFNDGWEYSNGCVFEFSVAADAGLPTFDSAARPLSRDDAVQRITRAVRELDASSLDTRAIWSSLHRLARRSAP